MDRRQAISRMFAALTGAAAVNVPSFTYAKPSSRDLQGLTLDAKITDLKTGQPIAATIKYLTPEEFQSKYGLSIIEQDKPQKIGVEISAQGHVTYATAGYLDAVTGTIFLQNQYGDNERALIPENDLLVKELYDVVCRQNIDVGGLIKHPDLRNVKYQIKATKDSAEAQYAEGILIDAVERVTNGYVKLPNGIFVREPNLTKPTSLATAPLDTFQLFPDPTMGVGTGSLRRVKTGNGYYSMVQLPYINISWIARIREEVFGGLGMSGEPGRETGTPDLEEKIALFGGIVFGGDKSSIKADDPTISDLATQVIKLFATRAIGNRKYPLNVKFPVLYDFDPGHALSLEQIPLAIIPGDFNNDGKVDFEDFFAFAAVFGERQDSINYNKMFDLDNDGVIGFGDFFLFAENFGKKR